MGWEGNEFPAIWGECSWPAGEAELLTAADATPRPPPSQPPGVWRASTPDLRAVAAAHAFGWRRRLASSWDATRMPAVLSNASVLATAKSVERLEHPWLPLSISGYQETGG